MQLLSLRFPYLHAMKRRVLPLFYRSQGMGLLQISSRIGAASAPWVAKGLKTVHRYAPFLVMGVSSVLASIFMLLLPETKGRKTAEVIEDKSEHGPPVLAEFHKDPYGNNAKVNLGYSGKDESTKF